MSIVIRHLPLTALVWIGKHTDSPRVWRAVERELMRRLILTTRRVGPAMAELGVEADEMSLALTNFQQAWGR